MLNGLQRAFPKAYEGKSAGVIPTRSSPECYGKDSGRAMKDRRQKSEEGRGTLVAGVERGNARLVEFMALDCRGATRLQDVQDGGVQDLPALLHLRQLRKRTSESRDTWAMQGNQSDIASSYTGQGMLDICRMKLVPLMRDIDFARHRRLQ